ncbi:MAG: hypothetical protein K0U16_07415 [Gammaproteobacteria bacterium]|nr:hypothetical protein [Gammaproteobacteria bacterium]
MVEQTKKLVQTEAWVGIVEDILDLILLIVSVLYIFLLNDTSLRLSEETMTTIGASAATARLLLRRILTRIVEARIAKKDSK